MAEEGKKKVIAWYLKIAFKELKKEKDKDHILRVVRKLAEKSEERSQRGNAL